MNRFLTILCHPTKIGLYIKDKKYIISLYVLIFMALTIGVMATKTFTTSYLNNDVSESLVQELSHTSTKAPTDMVFDGTTLKSNTGTYTFRETGLYITFLNNDYQDQNKTARQSLFSDSSYTFQFAFYSDKVLMQYSNYSPVTINYSDYDFSKFSVYELTNGDFEAQYNLQKIINVLFEKNNINYQIDSFVDVIIDLLKYYLLTILVCFIISILVNPLIDSKTRIKLVFYDSIIYFLMYILMYLFAEEYIKYAAFLLPLIYVFFTFKHIVRVKKR